MKIHDLVTIPTAAKLAQVSRQHLEAKIARGMLKAHYVGGRRFLSRAEIKLGAWRFANGRPKKK